MNPFIEQLTRDIEAEKEDEIDIDLESLPVFEDTMSWDLPPMNELDFESLNSVMQDISTAVSCRKRLSDAGISKGLLLELEARMPDLKFPDSGWFLNESTPYLNDRVDVVIETDLESKISDLKDKIHSISDNITTWFDDTVNSTSNTSNTIQTYIKRIRTAEGELSKAIANLPRAERLKIEKTISKSVSVFKNSRKVSPAVLSVVNGDDTSIKDALDRLDEIDGEFLTNAKLIAAIKDESLIGELTDALDETIKVTKPQITDYVKTYDSHDDELDVPTVIKDIDLYVSNYVRLFSIISRFEWVSRDQLVLIRDRLNTLMKSIKDNEELDDTTVVEFTRSVLSYLNEYKSYAKLRYRLTNDVASVGELISRVQIKIIKLLPSDVETSIMRKLK